MYARTAVSALARVDQRQVSSSCLSVLKKLSATALSQQSPRRLISGGVHGRPTALDTRDWRTACRDRNDARGAAWSAMDQRHPQRRGCQITMQRGAERPPDDTPRKEIDDDGEVVPAFAMSLTTDTGHGRLPRIVPDQGVH